MRPLLSMLILLIATFAHPPAVHAVTICSAPMRPTCIGMDFTYNDESSETRCTQDIERFDAEVDEYAQCLEKLIRETRRDAEDARDEFDEKAREE